MEYILNISFKDKPECKYCMLSFSQMDGKVKCAGLANRPKCPEDGARKDCPLTKK